MNTFPSLPILVAFLNFLIYNKDNQLQEGGIIPMDALLLSRWQFAITTTYHFLFVPLTLGTLNLRGLVGDLLYPNQQTALEGDLSATGEILWYAIPDQFCHGRCDWYRPGISLWNELVGVFPFYGRYIRCAAGT
jgi:hypothetical protein